MASSVDTVNNEIIVATINDPTFQKRVRLRFIVAAIAVSNELTTITNHVQRLAFAGALFNSTVDVSMLCMLVLSSSTNVANLLANPTTQGGNIMDADIDAQVTSVFTGVALSRSW